MSRSGFATNTEEASARLKMFFGPQRKFNHTFQQLIGWKTNEVAQNQFLSIKAYKVPELKRLGTRRVNEITVSVVHDDQISRYIKARSPGLTERPFECVARKTLPRYTGSADLREDLMRQRNQSLRFANNIVLADSNL